jgi:hypothetical protein
MSLRPRLQAAGYEPPDLLAGDEPPPPPPRTASCVHAGRRCAGDAPPLTDYRRHVINQLLFLLQTATSGSTHQSATAPASSHDAGDAD